MNESNKFREILRDIPSLRVFVPGGGEGTVVHVNWSTDRVGVQLDLGCIYMSEHSFAQDYFESNGQDVVYFDIDEIESINSRP